MIGQLGFFDMGDRPAELSKKGAPLERIGWMVDFELLRGDLEVAVQCSDRAKRGQIGARVEHAFAAQKGSMDLFIRTIGLPRATTMIGLVNLMYNFKRLVWFEHRAAGT